MLEQNVMRCCNKTGILTIGATAAAMLIVQMQAPASATTGLPPSPTVTTNNSEARPESAPDVPAAPGEVIDAKPAEESAAAQPEEVKPKPLPPSLVARINLTTQTMTVQANGATVHTWKVSTGARGYATPPGTFKPGWMSRLWHSRQYDNAPMPHSVFFNGGIAVHGTYATGSLGRAASHGCVRLAPGNAARFYQLVSKHGLGMTKIVVHGAQPFARPDRIARSSRGHHYISLNEATFAPSRGARGRTASRSRAMRSGGYLPAPRYLAARSPMYTSSRY